MALMPTLCGREAMLKGVGKWRSGDFYSEKRETWVIRRDRMSGEVVRGQPAFRRL